MSARQLLLFDVDGVLVEAGELRRLAGAAEALAQLRGTTDAVLSLITKDSEDQATRKTTTVGVDRYLDFEVGAFDTDTDQSGKVALARSKAGENYQSEFTLLAITAASVEDVTRVRPDADTVIAVAEETDAAALRAAGADHVVTGLREVVDLARSSQVG